jgi:hypothetical protein
MNISTKKDWFEFILDLNLLDKHLSNEQGSQGKFFNSWQYFIYFGYF